MLKEIILIAAAVAAALLLLIGAVIAAPKTENGNETTAPAPAQTQAITETAPVVSQPTQLPVQILFLQWPAEAVRGTNATVTVRGEPDTLYSIKVYYKSGPSAAEGLEDKHSNAQGTVSWTWEVSSRTTPGEYKIVVSGGGAYAAVEYRITE